MVYFISDGEYTKIGYAKDVKKRLQQLQTANGRTLRVLYIVPGGKPLEKKFHKVLDEYRTGSKNEWFDVSNIDIIQAIKGSNLNDIQHYRHKANMVNNRVKGGRDSFQRAKDFSEIKSAKKKRKAKRSHKSNVRNMLNELKHHLENYPDKMVSYRPYIKKYNMTKAEISFYVRGAKLSKSVFDHNAKVSGN